MINKNDISYGTMMMMSTLETLNISNINTALVNIWTLIRNAINSNKDSGAILDIIMNDLQSFRYAIEDRFTSATDNKNRLICFYYPSNYFLTDECRRPLSAINIKTSELVKKVFKCFDKYSVQITDNILSELIYFDTTPQVSADILLKSYMEHRKDFLKEDMLEPNINLMVSHIPFDWYIGDNVHNKNIKPTHILESFTSKLSQTDLLYNKLNLPKDPLAKLIPFNKYTHILFGDKMFVKGIVSEEKKKLFLKYINNKKRGLFDYFKNFRLFEEDLEVSTDTFISSMTVTRDSKLQLGGIPL